MIDHDAIRARLSARLKELNLSRTGVWLKANGIGQTTVRNFLDGTNQSLTVDTVSKLAPPLGTNERWILFGAEGSISDDVLREMAETAVEEIQAGMRIEEIRSTVASALRDQLTLHLSVGATPGISGGATSLGTAAPPPAPTNEGEQAGSRTA